MSLHLKLLLLVLLIPFYVTCVDPGPMYPPTKGEVWPKPQYQVKGNKYYVLKSNILDIKIPNYTCDILEAGIKRLVQRFNRRQYYINDNLTKHHRYQFDKSSNETLASQVTEFIIVLDKQCQIYPHLYMDEQYQLTVGETIVLSSSSIWGILRGLETFNQLIYYSDDYTELRINVTNIKDFPAYTHRGLLIDTGRHYLQLETIRRIIDAMEMNKMNVLHWHIVDDQSFPYQSTIHPKLSKYGAYHSSMVYTKEDIEQIIERGRLAGIRVLAEFDIPGHVRSWGNGYPIILTKCYKDNKVIGLGPLNPIKNVTYSFLELLYKEVAELFPDEYIHLGGDEVDTDCWNSNPKIKDYVKRHHIKNLTMLQTLFMSKIRTILPQKTKHIYWQEVFDSRVPLPNSTILQVWKYEWIEEMDNILNAGYLVVYSSEWYLDEINKDWTTYYRVDPRNEMFIKRLNATGLDNIIGGEACMWGEKVDDTNILSRIWPRASAVAERLWTGMDYKNILPIDPVTDHARRRIEEHVCRMRQNGIPAEPPNGPGFCFGAGSTSQQFSRTRLRRIHRRKYHKVKIVEK